MMMNVEQSVEWELAGETEVHGENLSLCPPQIPYDLTWARIRAAAVGSRRLTAWAMARSFTWGLHMEVIKAEAFRTYISVYYLFRRKRLGANIMLTLSKTVFSSILLMPVSWKCAAGTSFLNCSICKARFPHYCEILKARPGSELAFSFQTIIYVWLFTKHAGNPHKSSKIMRI
jgi:hypothetical protein